MQRIPALLLAVCGLALAGCGSSTSTSSPSSAPAQSSSSSSSSTTSSSGPASAKLGTATISGLGTVLVNAQGHTLYVFSPDQHSKVTCSAGCQSVWPPTAAPSSGKASAGSGVKASLIGSDPNPAGGRIVTYNGWPLYSYVTDNGPGQDHGQDLSLNGGKWYVMSPSGTPVTKAASGSSSSSSSSSSGY